MRRLFFSLSLWLLGTGALAQPHWPQFRGPQGGGVAEGTAPPTHFGESSNLLWKTALPPGLSSPCIWGGKIFLTALNQGQLERLGLDRKSGTILWRRGVAVGKIEPAHRMGSAAAPTPTTDGQRVYVYFGSFGLLAYDLEGQEQWRKALPPPVVEFGTSTSPITAGGLVILLCDQDVGSYLLAVDRGTGGTVWRVERPEYPRGFGTPMVWRHDDLEEVIVPGTLWLKAYDLRTGRERWKARGMSRMVCTMPVAGEGWLFTASWTTGGDFDANRMTMAPFETYLAGHDRNKDGRITRDEMTESALLERFSQIDLDKDQVLSGAEWTNMAAIMAKVENQAMAIKPGGQGDVSDTHVVWRQKRGIPYVPSPLYYRGRLYLVKNGGLASCLSAKTGEALYQEERLGALGDYYASLVAGGGLIYAISQTGVGVVYRAGDALEVLARNKLGETVLATPTIAEGRLYVRTANHLFAFGRE